MAIVGNEEEFWKNVENRNTVGCWIWKGKITKGKYRYGMFLARGADGKRLGGKYAKAHRVSYIIASQEFIPNSLWCLHRCGKSLCVNPDHLYLGTPRENWLDQMRHGTCGLKGKENWPPEHFPNGVKGIDTSVKGFGDNIVTYCPHCNGLLP